MLRSKLFHLSRNILQISKVRVICKKILSSTWQLLRWMPTHFGVKNKMVLQFRASLKVETRWTPWTCILLDFPIFVSIIQYTIQSYRHLHMTAFSLNKTCITWISRFFKKFMPYRAFTSSWCCSKITSVQLLAMFPSYFI